MVLILVAVVGLFLPTDLEADDDEQLLVNIDSLVDETREQPPNGDDSAEPVTEADLDADTFGSGAGSRTAVLPNSPTQPRVRAQLSGWIVTTQR
ncbi:MAG: hypothetical protein J07HX64_02234 [halophilic archaeon J07HX64]|nr:MAG: hypothetical protein J07HX64_02234 [halophilic archaeon J07HX64]